MTTRTKQRKLRFQALEDRSLMAGDVSVAVNGGSLFISGNTDANTNLIITQTALHTFLILGLDTKLNNSNVPFIARGVTGGISINLLGGNDKLAFTGGLVDGDLSIHTGAGNDSVNLSFLAVNGNGFINTTTDGQTSPESRVKSVKANNVSNNGSDADTVTITGAVFAGSLNNNSDLTSAKSLTKSSSNPINTLLGKFSGLLQKASSFARQIQTLLVQFGNKLNGILNPEGGNLTVETGGGDDKVNVTGVIATRTVNLNTGEGKDKATAQGVATSSLSVDMGDGNDTLSLTYVAAQQAFLDGGIGSNKLTRSNNLFLSPPTTSGF